MNAGRRRWAALAVVFAVGACASAPLPEPTASPAPDTPPAVIIDAQLERILSSVSETLVAADAASSPEALVGRVTGPARVMREAEYALAAATDGQDPVTPLVTAPQVAIVSATTEWPRLVSVVTEIPEGANLPLLLALVQTEARDNYQLWSWVRLLPGTEMPATVNPEVGSPPVAADSDALRISPTVAVEHYADLLAGGDEFAAEFAEDAFRTRFLSSVATLSEGVSVAGEAETTATPSEHGVQAIGTNDGGAIVFAAIDQRLIVRRTVAGATLQVGEGLAYGGDREVRGTLTASYLVSIALHVPPAGSEEQVRVLGFEQVLTGVERDDSTSPD